MSVPEPINLPDADTVSQNVRDWAASDSGFAWLLTSGVSHSQALGHWGTRLLRKNRNLEATQFLRSAAAVRPDDPLVWTNLGIALDRTEELAEAQNCLERSVELAPDQADSWLLLATVRKKRGEFAAADFACRQALQCDPESALAWQCLALVKQALRHYQSAIECFGKCCELQHPDAAVMANLGRLYYQVGKIPEAQQAYQSAVRLQGTNLHYQQMLRRVSFLKAVLDEVPVDDALAAYRNSLPTPDQGTGDDISKLLSSAFGLFSGFGHPEAAARIGRKQLELGPDSAVEYLLRAVTGDQQLVRAPADFVTQLFDGFAETFEAQLVGELGYDVPEQLSAILDEMLPAEGLLDVLDAGCGTGLCGAFLRSRARRLTGVDLSPKMLEQADSTGHYDSLVCADLVDNLEQTPGCYDLVVAADVCIYFGDLQPLITAFALAIRPGGRLALNTEYIDGTGFQIRHSGRFGHAPAYIRMLANVDFEESLATDTTLRLEGTERLRGNIFVFRRR